jgi:MFS family permease
MFIVGRAMAGIGCAGLTTGMLTIIAACTSIDKRPFYTGIILGVSAIGLTIGPVLGGVFTQEASWRWCRFSY